MSRILSLLFLFFTVTASAQTFQSSPSESLKNSVLNVVINGSGTNWVKSGYSYAYVNVSGLGVEVKNGVTIPSSNKLNFQLDVSNDAKELYRDVTVIYYNGNTSDTTTEFNGFYVIPSEIKSVDPDNGTAGDTVDVDIYAQGTNWDVSPGSVNVTTSSADVNVSNVGFIDSSKLSADFEIMTGAPYGMIDVYVEFDNGKGVKRTDSLSDAFRIDTPSTNHIVNITDLEFKVWPNPFENEFQLFTNREINGDVQIDLVDIKGSTITILKSTHLSKQNVFHLEGLESGVYILRLSAPEGETFQKVIKL